MLRIIGLFFLMILLSGCLFIDEIEDTIAAKDLKMSNAGMDFGYTRPTDSLQVLDPSKWSAQVTYLLEADNSMNAHDAKVGSVALVVTMDTAGAEPIHLSNPGVTIPAGKKDTLEFRAPVTYANHATALTYIVKRKQAGQPLDMSVGGTYDFEISTLPGAVVTIPAQDISVNTN